MTPFYLDIETIPGQRSGLREEIAAALRPPGNYKKPETIAEWEKNEKPRLVEEQWLKTTFDGAECEVILIGFARDDDSIEVVRAPTLGDEYRLLEEAFEMMEASLRPSDVEGRIRCVGHRVSDFDLRILWQRAVIHGIKPPEFLPFHAKPWDVTVFDTMFMWAGAGKFVTLDKLCRALAVAQKGTEIGEDIDGSKVWDFYSAGRLDELERYCGGDVSRVREIYKRMVFAETRFST